jgi:primosomal protein N'
LEKLIQAKKCRILLKEKARYVIPPEEREEPHEMTLDQHAAFDAIEKAPQNVVLLQGVTGSGKTEVYLRLSEKVLDAGKTVLMLVPEINLTPVMVEYFSRRFGRRSRFSIASSRQGNATTNTAGSPGAKPGSWSGREARSSRP